MQLNDCLIVNVHPLLFSYHTMTICTISNLISVFFSKMCSTKNDLDLKKPSRGSHSHTSSLSVYTHTLLQLIFLVWQLNKFTDSSHYVQL